MDNKWDLFQKFLITQDVEISIEDLLVNSVLVIVLSLVLEFTYLKCGRTFSNRKMFAQNFYLIAFTTMLIISIVKSSLALSLGLVGALSIVRFRAAIKEPEELSYLFLAIALGLGLGANQHVIVPIAFGIILGIIWIKNFIAAPRTDKQNLFLTIQAKESDNFDFNKLVEVISSMFKRAEIRRFDQEKGSIEATFQIESARITDLEKCSSSLKGLGVDIQMTYINSDA